MKRRWIFVVLIAAVCCLVLGCRATGIPQEDETSAPTGAVGLPNPAAVFCQEQGHEYEIRTADDGSQYGVCIFADGSECDGWAFFRGECGPLSDDG